MAVDIKIACELRDGQVWPKNPDLYMQKLHDAGDANDCQLIITGSNVRSPNQHRYAFAVCNVIAETEQNKAGLTLRLTGSISVLRSCIARI